MSQFIADLLEKLTAGAWLIGLFQGNVWAVALGIVSSAIWFSIRWKKREK